MPSVCRRIVVLLCAALLCVGALPLSAAHAQGAGDQQYSDPFGDSGDSGSSNSDDNSSGSSSDPEPLTPAPQTSGDGSSSSGSSGTSGTAGTSSSGTGTTAAAPAATLPNTGLDTRVLLLGGAILVLLGLGLRLRNAPERF